MRCPRRVLLATEPNPQTRLFSDAVPRASHFHSHHRTDNAALPLPLLHNIKIGNISIYSSVATSPHDWHIANLRNRSQRHTSAACCCTLTHAQCSSVKMSMSCRLSAHLVAVLLRDSQRPWLTSMPVVNCYEDEENKMNFLYPNLIICICRD